MKNYQRVPLGGAETGVQVVHRVGPRFPRAVPVERVHSECDVAATGSSTGFGGKV